jgi:hypothetical protein
MKYHALPLEWVRHVLDALRVRVHHHARLALITRRPPRRTLYGRHLGAAS